MTNINTRLSRAIQPWWLRWRQLPPWEVLTTADQRVQFIPGTDLTLLGTIRVGNLRIGIADGPRGPAIFSVLYVGIGGANSNWREDTVFTTRQSFLAARATAAYNGFFARARRPAQPRRTLTSVPA